MGTAPNRAPNPGVVKAPKHAQIPKKLRFSLGFLTSLQNTSWEKAVFSWVFNFASKYVMGYLMGFNFASEYVMGKGGFFLGF